MRSSSSFLRRSRAVVDPSVPDEHVAAFPNTYITAWQMLVGKAGVSPADTVFVWAGTSGLGGAAIEIARLAGATVIATAGTEEKREVLRRRSDPDARARPSRAGSRRRTFSRRPTASGATIVFEHIGQATWERSLELCAPGGTIVSAGATSGDDAQMNITTMFVKQVRILGSRLGTMTDTIDAATHLSAGRFRPLSAAVAAARGARRGTPADGRGPRRREGDHRAVGPGSARRRP